MDKVWVVLFVLGVLFFSSLGEYISGRVILPAVGFTAPEYWTWFWFMFWVLAFVIPARIVSGVISDM